MAIKISLRRFVALLLCCLLVGSSFARLAYASDPVTAASLAITGGQLAGAGLSGEAALSLAGPVGAVVGVTLGALGVNAYVSKAAQEAGKSRTRFVLDKLVLWGARAGYTQEQLYSKIAQGISVAADGTIHLGKDAAKMVEQFGSWLFTQDGVVVPSVSAPSGSGISIDMYSPMGGTVVPYSEFSNPSSFFTYYDSSGTKYAFGFFSSNAASVGASIYLCRFSGNNNSIGILSSTILSNVYVGIYGFKSNGDINYLGGSSIGFNVNQKAGNYYITYLSSYSPVAYTSDFPDFVNINTFISDVNGKTWSESTPTTHDEVFTGTPESWAENKDVLNPSAEDTPVVLNPDLLNPIIESLADGQQATMSIIDYLQALQDAWDHALDDVQTAIGTITDSLTGIQEQIAVPQDAVENPTVTNPSVTPETTPVLDPSAVDPGTVVTGLSFDLTQIFPFCIPFDIYDMLATLSATPEAPVYHVHYEGPYNIVIDFTVDLSPWDSVAAVLRTVELLAFCIGLAYVTRSMFIRS